MIGRVLFSSIRTLPDTLIFFDRWITGEQPVDYFLNPQQRQPEDSCGRDKKMACVTRSVTQAGRNNLLVQRRVGILVQTPFLAELFRQVLMNAIPVRPSSTFA